MNISKYFEMWYGLFEPTVMQFEKTNAQPDLVGYINIAIRKALDDFASAYLDGALINSDSEEKQIGHVKWVMQ
jgi:hypothetical protein